MSEQTREQDQERSTLSKTAGAVVGFVVVFAAAMVVHGAIVGNVHGPGTIGAPDGPAITVEGSTGIDLSTPPDSGELVLETDDGNATFTSNGRSAATIHVDDLDGSWTNLSAIDASNELTVDAEGMDKFSVAGDAETLSVAATRQADDGSVDFAYSGSNGGSTTVTLWGLTDGTTYGAVDESETVLDHATANSSGAATFSLPTSAHDVRLQTNDGPPAVSDLRPTGTVRSMDQTLEATIDDPDFPADTVTVEWYVDGSKVDTTTVDSSGTVSTSVAGLSEGDHDWHVVATDGYGQSTTSNTQTLTVDHYDPVVVDAEPTGETTTYPETVNATIEDGDFGLDGDQLDVHFDLNGDDIGSETLTSNGTATADIGRIPAGTNTWTVTVEDEYGQTTTEEFSFSSPEELEIRNETSPADLITDTTVELQFYYPESGGEVAEIYTRETNDGSINMTGLPADRPFTVVADTAGYTPRRIFVPSLFEAQDVYLLPENETNVESIFEIEDYTGGYPQESSVLEVERSINGSWQTVVGDYFGANGEFPAQIAYNERHRLVMRNVDTGETRVLGSYTPLTSGRQSVVVSPRGVEDVKGAGVISAVSPATERLPARDDVDLTATLDSGDETSISEWSIEVFYDETNGGNESLVSKQSLSDGGDLSASVDLADRPAGEAVVVVNYQTDDGETGQDVKRYAVIEETASDYTFLSALDSLMTQVAPGNQGVFQSTTALILSVVLTGAVAARLRRISTEMLGLVHAGFVTMFTILGWLPYSLLFIVAVGWASLTFLGRRY